MNRFLPTYQTPALRAESRPILLWWAVFILCFGIGQISDNVLKSVGMGEENGE